MNPIDAGDLVEIVKVDKDQQHLLHKVGRVVMIAGGTKCVVAFNDGSGATVTIDQLRKVR